MPTTNDAPHIIPSLREWVAGKGKLFVTADSRLVVDTAHAADLLNTANTFQEDIQSIRSLTLPIVTAPAAGSGDIFLTLDSADTGIADRVSGIA